MAGEGYAAHHQQRLGDVERCIVRPGRCRVEIAVLGQDYVQSGCSVQPSQGAVQTVSRLTPSRRTLLQKGPTAILMLGPIAGQDGEKHLMLDVAALPGSETPPAVCPARA